jgi:hypothetical protein
MPRLTIDYIKSDSRASMMTQAHYRRIVHRLETDTSIPPKIRIAGLFVGLYAQRRTHIAALTNARISTDTTDAPVVWFLTHPCRTHVGGLIRQYRKETHTSPAPDPTGWFFPSRNAGQHLSTSTLTRGLSRIGVDTRQIRGAALTNLAAHLPIRPLCDLTGQGSEAAVRWADIAARSWNAYPQLRGENYSNSARVE